MVDGNLIAMVSLGLVGFCIGALSTIYGLGAMRTSDRDEFLRGAADVASLAFLRRKPSPPDRTAEGKGE